MKTGLQTILYILIIISIGVFSCTDKVSTEYEKTKPDPEILGFNIADINGIENITIVGLNFAADPKNNLILFHSPETGTDISVFPDFASETILRLNKLAVAGFSGDTLDINLTVFRMDGEQQVQSNVFFTSFVKQVEVEIIDQEIVWPMGIDQDDDGNIYVGSGKDKKIYKITPEGVKSEFVNVMVMGHIHFGPENFLYVCQKDSNKIVRVSLDGSIIEDYVDVPKPVDFDWDINHNMYIVSNDSGVFKKAVEDSQANELLIDSLSIKNCRVFDGYLYVSYIWAGKISRYEITDSGLGEEEVYLEDNAPNSFDFDKEGTMYFTSAWIKSLFTFSLSGSRDEIYQNNLLLMIRYMSLVGSNLYLVHPGWADVGLVMRVTVAVGQAPRYGREADVTGIF